MLKKIVSGGQTGVDRAALDSAIRHAIPHGGWCPRGRRAEDGVIDAVYELVETPGHEYSQRTEYNVRDADGTLILKMGRLEGGTAFTARVAAAAGRPCLIVDLSAPADLEVIRTWLDENHIRVLNIAGPRASKSPGIYARATEELDRMLNRLLDSDISP